MFGFNRKVRPGTTSFSTGLLQWWRHLPGFKLTSFHLRLLMRFKCFLRLFKDYEEHKLINNNILYLSAYLMNWKNVISMFTI